MSNYIEIDKKPVIFDDPESCGDEHKKCEWFSIPNDFCNYFKTKIDNVDPFKFGFFKYKKCDECKTAWKSAKERQSKPCSECDELIGIDPDGVYICLHRHCADHPAY